MSKKLPPEPTSAVGARVRAMRASRELSIRQLADRAGISTGMISKVERGLTEPSLQTIRAIARALQIPVFDLFAEPARADVSVVRRDRRFQLRSPHGDMTYERLSPGAGQIELLLGTLQPGAASSPDRWTHPSEECVVVVSGELVVEVDEEEFQLAIGDTCYFNSRLPHRYRNDGSEPTTFLVTVTPPSY